MNHNNNVHLIQDIKIVQHNVMHWTTERAVELCNYYHHENPDLILLNSTSIINYGKIKIYNYNVTHTRKKNYERHAGIAIAVKKNINYRILDNIIEDILGVELTTTKGPIIILTNYSPPRRNFMPIGKIEDILQKKISQSSLLVILMQISLH